MFLSLTKQSIPRVYKVVILLYFYDLFSINISNISDIYLFQLRNLNIFEVFIGELKNS